MALFNGILFRSGDGGRWQTGEFGFVGDDFFPGVGRVEAVLGILLGDLGETFLHFSGTRFFLGRQVGTLLAKVGECFVNVALLGGRELIDGGAFAKGFECFPKRLIEWYSGEELSNFGQYCVMGVAQLGAVVDRVEMANQAPGVVERFKAIVERGNGVFVGQCLGSIGAKSGNAIDCGLGIDQCFADVRLDVVGSEGGPADVELCL